MDLTPDQAALAAKRHDCPNCEAPARSACRIRRPEDPLTPRKSSCATTSRPGPTRTPKAPAVDDLATVRAQECTKMYDELLEAATRLDMLRRLEGGSVDPHATAAMHAVRFAATILWPRHPEHPAARLPPRQRTPAPARRQLARGSARTRRVRAGAPRPAAHLRLRTRRATSDRKPAIDRRPPGQDPSQGPWLGETTRGWPGCTAAGPAPCVLDVVGASPPLT